MEELQEVCDALTLPFPVTDNVLPSHAR
jgi:hypothetical protein